MTFFITKINIFTFKSNLQWRLYFSSLTFVSVTSSTFCFCSMFSNYNFCMWESRKCTCCEQFFSQFSEVGIVMGIEVWLFTTSVVKFGFLITYKTIKLSEWMCSSGNVVNNFLHFFFSAISMQKCYFYLQYIFLTWKYGLAACGKMIDLKIQCVVAWY